MPACPATLQCLTQVRKKEGRFLFPKTQQLKADFSHLIILSPFSDMLSNGPMRGSMQQGWGPQGHMGGSGALMGQGMGPGRMLPSMNAALATRGLPASRGMVNMQMMGGGEEARNQPLLTAEPFLTPHVSSSLQKWRWQTPPTLSNMVHPIRRRHGPTKC